MSGDANTALGNCIINYALLRQKFGDEAIIYLDGDDSVVFMKNYVSVDFADTGMESKINVVRSFHEIEFCQSSPVQSSIGWIMCKNPIRSLSRAIFKCGHLPTNIEDYLTTIGVGEGYCSPEMPLISALAARFRMAKGEYKWYFSDYRLATNKCTDEFLMPSSLSRSSFAITFDLDVPSQKLMEQELAAMVLASDQH
jgi:hypothetical protein